MAEVATSILSVKKDEAIKTFYNLESAGTDYYHIDVMDGEFVKNNTIDLMLEYCEYLKSITNVPLDVHLMVQDVEEFIKGYAIFEPNNITFHYEACKNKEELLKFVNLIKENNCKVGVSIKPNTEAEKIYDILPYIHTVLVMTVEPGQGGQKLIKETIEKIKKLKKYIQENNLDTEIEADGGINLENVDELKNAGCDIIVAGTSIINSKDFKDTIKKMK